MKNILELLRDKDFFKDTTLHGPFYVARSKSKILAGAWFCLFCLSSFYAMYQICSEIRTFHSKDTMIFLTSIGSDSKIEYPPLELCFTHWIQWLDWNKAYNVMNLTKPEIFFLMNLHLDYLNGRIHKNRAMFQKFEKKFARPIDLTKLLLDLSVWDAQTKGLSIYFNVYGETCALINYNILDDKRIILAFNTEIPKNANLTKTEAINYAEHLKRVKPMTTLKLLGEDYKGESIAGVSNDLDVIITPSAISKISDICEHSEPPMFELPMVQCTEYIFDPSYKECLPSAQAYPVNRFYSCPKPCKNPSISSFKFNQAKVGVPLQPSCTSWKYDMTIKFNINLVVKEKSIFIKFHLNPDNKGTIVTKHRRLTWDQLVANVGGILGVYTGASIFSLLHVTLILCQLLCHSVKKLLTWKRKNNATSALPMNVGNNGQNPDLIKAMMSDVTPKQPFYPTVFPVSTPPHLCCCVGQKFFHEAPLGRPLMELMQTAIDLQETSTQAICFNFSEKECVTAADSKKWDLASLRRMASEHNLDPSDIADCYRLGGQEGTERQSARVMKIQFLSTHARNAWLRTFQRPACEISTCLAPPLVWFQRDVSKIEQQAYFN